MKGGGFAMALVVLPLLAFFLGKCTAFSANYKDALQKSILFFEGQRSGKLPQNQRMTWRRDSALDDGKDIGVDLVGGYYDAGDNVKFGFPLAFTATMLSWGIIEFGDNMGGEAANARLAVRWTTDYLLKATSQQDKIHIQVGDPYADHDCWERPEDMDTKRTVFSLTPEAPGSEAAAETAAALAAASVVFKGSDPAYASTLLARAISVFDFADRYRGSYTQSLGKWVCPFYCDSSGYMDELVWGAAWLYTATNDSKYWDYVRRNVPSIWGSNSGEFGWDDKHGGIYVLLSQKLLGEPQNPLASLLGKAQEFACGILPNSPTRSVEYSPGGLIFKLGSSNLQHATSLSFLLVVYAKYLKTHGKTIGCRSLSDIPPSRLVQVAKSQVDYILGNNPLGMSYMVGYSNKFPQHIHHRGSSLPSIKDHPERISCGAGKSYFESPKPNPNILVGAIVGGPSFADRFPDSRALFNESEPATYLNAPLVGTLGYFSSPT